MGTMIKEGGYVPAGEVGCVNRVRLSIEEAQKVLLEDFQRPL